MFQFDIRTLITIKASEPKRHDRIEVHARVLPEETETPIETHRASQVMFDATGSGAHPRIVEWRSSVPEEEVGRFAPDEAQICLTFAPFKQLFTFIEEYREQFDNYSYIFDREQIQSRIDRILKQVKSHEDESDAS